MKSLLASCALATLVSSCADFGHYRLVTDGFRFDYGGATAEAGDSGALPADVDRLEVDHRFGEVRVESSSDQSPAGWSWTARAWADDAALARELLDQVQVAVTSSAGVVRFELVVPPHVRKDLRGLESDLTIVADGGADVVLDNAHGDTRVLAMGGAATLRTRHGDVSVEGLAGALDLEHAHGELFATSISDGRIRLEHGAVVVRDSGALEVRTRHAHGSYDGVRGDLDISSEHGDVEVIGVRSVRARGAHARWSVLDTVGIELTNRHGDVTARMLEGGARLDVEHGDVTVQRTAGGGAGATTVRCRHGDVEVDLLAGGRVEIDVEHGDGVVRHWLEGDARVEATAEHGRVDSDLPVVSRLGRDGQGAVVHVEHGDARVVRVGGGAR